MQGVEAPSPGHVTAAGPARPVRHWRAPAVLAMAGGVALLLGLLVYASDRDPARALLLPATWSLPGGRHFGTCGDWLPSFVHPLAFSLFTAALLRPGAAPAYGACAGWWAVNLAFELGQHAQVKTHLAAAVQVLLGDSGPARALSQYWLHGRFDGGDIAAATAGALTAAALLRLSHDLGKRHAH